MSFFDRFLSSKKQESSDSLYSIEQLNGNKELLHDCFASKNWNGLSYQDKLNCLQALENDFAAQQGRPALTVEDSSLGYYGAYSPETDKIYIDKNLIDHGNFEKAADANHPAMPDANMQLFDTVAHEGYHGYQNYAMRNPDIHQDKHQLSEWSMNEGHYYSNRSGDLYFIQPQERDAWMYGYEETSKAFDAIEERNGIEPGRHEYEKMSSMCSYDQALSRVESYNPDIRSQMENQMKDSCKEQGIEYDYEDSEVIPSMVEDKESYKESRQEQSMREEENQNNKSYVNTSVEDNGADGQVDSSDELTKMQESGLTEGNDEMSAEGMLVENEDMNEPGYDLRSFDQDPFLGNDDRDNDSLTSAVSDNDWEEAMKDVPTFSEHMEQIQKGEGYEHERGNIEWGQDNYITESNVNDGMAGEQIDNQEGQDSNLTDEENEIVAEKNEVQEEQASNLTEDAEEMPAEEIAEQEEQASDLTEGVEDTPAEENTEQEEQASDLTEGVEDTPAEENTEQEEQASDLTESVEDTPAEESAEQEEQANDLTEGAEESPAEENTEQEEQASDLTEGTEESPAEESAEQEEQTSDLSNNDSEQYSDNNEDQSEDQSYGY